MKLQNLIFVGALFFAPTLASAAGCTVVIPSAAVQKFSLIEAVRSTEKQPVHHVEITAPGLAVVSYGEKRQKVAVTFRYRCLDQFTPEQVAKNPTGFWIDSYVSVNK